MITCRIHRDVFIEDHGARSTKYEVLNGGWMVAGEVPCHQTMDVEAYTGILTITLTVKEWSHSSPAGFPRLYRPRHP